MKHCPEGQIPETWTRAETVKPTWQERKIARLTRERDELRGALEWLMRTSPTKSDYDDAMQNAAETLKALANTEQS